jgi:hypothetical protein
MSFGDESGQDYELISLANNQWDAVLDIFERWRSQTDVLSR